MNDKKRIHYKVKMHDLILQYNASHGNFYFTLQRNGCCLCKILSTFSKIGTQNDLDNWRHKLDPR